MGLFASVGLMTPGVRAEMSAILLALFLKSKDGRQRKSKIQK